MDVTSPSAVPSDADRADGGSSTSTGAVDATADPDAGDARDDAAVDSSNAPDDLMRFNTFTVANQGAIATSMAYRIVQSSGGWVCGGADYANAAFIEIDFPTTDGTLKPGVYSVNTVTVHAAFETLDGACNPKASHPAQSGTITVTSVDATNVKGMYDIFFSGFGANGRALGGFIAPVCDTAAWGPGKVCSP